MYFCKMEIVESIKNRLKYIPEAKLKGLSDYVDFLIENETDDFELTQEQIDELEKRSKTPIEDYIPARELMAQIKQKYFV